MPLVAHNQLPTFRRLREGGQEILSAERALKQDIRELHIGFLNMMPDAVLSATEKQFFRLVGASNRIAQFYLYPFSLTELNRGPDARKHIAEHYFDFEQLKTQGLDALIITGANVANPSLEQEAFWEPLVDIVRWAEGNVASILCSCLATHALVRMGHNIERNPLPEKKWGVYSHRVRRNDHPLTWEINTRFDAPHSRHNDVSAAQFEQAGMSILADSDEAGVHLAVSEDLFRTVYFQGHPEYDDISLLKEFKREVLRLFDGERDSLPEFPENYFSEAAQSIASAYLDAALSAKRGGQPLPDFPEDALAALVDNTWGDTGKAIVNNWLGLVYQLTNLDRQQQFMQDVDPNDPLKLK
jgi:homoserine O-succinyltransferase